MIIVIGHYECVRGIVAVRSGKKCVYPTRRCYESNDFCAHYTLFFPSLEHIPGVDFWFSNRMSRYVLYFFLILSIVRNSLSNYASHGALCLVFFFMSCFPFSSMNLLCFSWHLCMIKDVPVFCQPS